MIDFQRKEFRLASTVSVVSISVLFLTLLFLLFFPKPTTKGIAARFKKQNFRIQLDTKAMKDRTEEANDLISQNTWSGGAETVGPAALTQLTKIAARNKVKVTGFRPQRETKAEIMRTLPFLVNLEGPFTNVIQATRDIEASGSRLGVSLVQVTSSSAESDFVNASVGIVAYLKPGANDKVAKPTKSAPAKVTTKTAMTGGNQHRA